MSLEDVFQAHELDYDKVNEVHPKQKTLYKYLYSWKRLAPCILGIDEQMCEGRK